MTEYTKKILEKPSGILCKNCGKELKVLNIKMAFLKKKMMTIHLPCACVIDQHEKTKNEQEMIKMSTILKERGFYVGKYAHMTLNNWDKGNLSMDSVKVILDYIVSVNLNNRNWLYLYGDYGVGKTYISVAMTKKIAFERKWHPAIFQWTEFCNLIQQSWRDKSIKINWEMIKFSHILILDDIEKKSASEWMLEKLYDIIDCRYINNLPTIIIANHSIMELLSIWNKSRQTQELSKAIISRMMGQIVKVIHFKGQDYRLNRIKKSHILDFSK